MTLTRTKSKSKTTSLNEVAEENEDAALNFNRASKRGKKTADLEAEARKDNSQEVYNSDDDK